MIIIVLSYVHNLFILFSTLEVFLAKRGLFILNPHRYVIFSPLFFLFSPLPVPFFAISVPFFLNSVPFFLVSSPLFFSKNLKIEEIQKNFGFQKKFLYFFQGIQMQKKRVDNPLLKIFFSKNFLKGCNSIVITL